MKYFMILNNLVVGVTGFEPATTWSQTRCATGLRYAPIGLLVLPVSFRHRKVSHFFSNDKIIVHTRYFLSTSWHYKYILYHK